MFAPRSSFSARTARFLIDKVNYWTGVQRPLVKKLVETIEAKVGDLGLAR